MSVLNRRDTGQWRPRQAPPLTHWLPGGLCIGTAYALVIHAMQYISAAYAVAFTNAGILVAALLSMTLFGERARWRPRLLAITIAPAASVSSRARSGDGRARRGHNRSVPAHATL